MSTLLKKSAIIILFAIILIGCSLIGKTDKRLQAPPPSSAVSPLPDISPEPSPTPKPTASPEEPLPLPQSPSPSPPSPSSLPSPLPPSPSPSPASTSQVDASKLSSARKDWYYMKKPNNTVPGINEAVRPWLAKYGGYYVHNSDKKVIYLTFDEGYENGYTPSILDTLRKHSVTAAFFVTKPYVTGNPELVKRMVNEGHTVVNHTVTHRAMNELSDSEIEKELSGVAEEYKRVTGKDMLGYMRPPMGAYSERSLYVTSRAGYKTLFWSMAYVDWETNNQPTREQTMSFIKSGHHNGAIILLHAVSRTNTECLDEILTYLKGEGYTFEAITSIN